MKIPRRRLPTWKEIRARAATIHWKRILVVAVILGIVATIVGSIASLASELSALRGFRASTPRLVVPVACLL